MTASDRALLLATVLAIGASGTRVARPQAPAAGWRLIVRIVPNPLPAGRCAGISIEVQDAEGFRRGELSDGQSIDFRRFRYAADTTTDFQWKNGNPIEGYICAREKSVGGRTNVVVSMPDGLSASVEVTTVVPGQMTAPVQYPPQGPLRIAGREYKTPAPSASPSSSASKPKEATAPAPFEPRHVVVTATPIVFSGPNFTTAHARITASPIMFSGSNFTTPYVKVTTDRLELTLKYAPAATTSAPPENLRDEEMR